MIKMIWIISISNLLFELESSLTCGYDNKNGDKHNIVKSDNNTVDHRSNIMQKTNELKGNRNNSFH